MFAYDFDRLNALLKGILQKNLTPETWTWLEDQGKKARAKHDIAKFNIAFVAMPRKTGKETVILTPDEEAKLGELRADFTIQGWSIDRLARVWLLIQLNPDDRDSYVAVIENLYLSAEMGELVALYSSLPLLAYPDQWVPRCAEGIRSNIGQVLEAVICNNPYPSEQLGQAAWNQLVLKAIFTDKPVLEIVGLRKRANKALARALSDYAHERWAAYRPVNRLLWICVGPFIDSDNFSDIQRVFSSHDPLDQAAAALACYESAYEPAQRLLNENPSLKKDIESGKVTWSSLAEAVKVGEAAGR